MKTSLGMLVFLSFAPLLATADVVAPIDSVESYVNIRMEPDAKSEIVGRLRRGQQLVLVQSSDGWHKVSLEGGGSGFVHEDWSIVVADQDRADAASVEGVAEMPPSNADSGKTADAVVEDVEPAPSTVGEMTDAIVEADEPVDAAAVQGVVAESVDDVVDANDDKSTDADRAVAHEAAEEPPEAFVAELADEEDTIREIVPVLVGPAGPGGPAGPPGPQGAAAVEGSVDYLMKFTAPTIGGDSQIFDNGRSIGIGTDTPKQRLEVNGNIQIHEQNSSVAGLMLTQSSGETGYIMHNRASTLTIGAGSVDRITIDREGHVGIGMSRPTHPIEMASGAHVTAGGAWTNSSSIEKKENISDVTPEEALRTLAALEPVHFNYKEDAHERHMGFIAEDVPDLVATADRKGLSTMDIVAVLTKVVQMQQQKIDELESRLSE